MKKCLLVVLMLVICCAKENIPKDGVIRVNGTWLKKDNIDKIEELYRQQMLAAYPQKALEGLPPSLKKNIARQIIANEVVLQEAKKRNIGYNEEKFQQTLAGITKQFPDSASMERELAKMGQTREDMKKQIRDGLRIDSLIKTLMKPSDSVSTQACKDYYDGNKAKFASEKRYKASQILFIVKKDLAADKKKLIAEKADKVLKEIKAGKDFAAAAKKYSEDPATGKAGGDIGWFKKGDLMKEFDVAVAGLKQDEVSNVFETGAGFHIVKKTGEDTLPPQPFEQVKSQIKNLLELKKQNDVVKHYVDSLISVAKIVYADTSYKEDASMLPK
jgi:parvulin-like peptidyl-prolyl isomerase